MYVTVYNPGTSPVTVSASGRIVGGGEWGTANTTDEVAKEALVNGFIAKVDPPDDPSQTNAVALAAFETTANWTERQEDAQEVPKQELAEVAKLAEGEEGLSKPELVQRVAEDDTLVIEDKPKTTRSTQKK